MRPPQCFVALFLVMAVFTLSHATVETLHNLQAPVTLPESGMVSLSATVIRPGSLRVTSVDFYVGELEPHPAFSFGRQTALQEEKCFPGIGPSPHHLIGTSEALPD